LRPLASRPAAREPGQDLFAARRHDAFLPGLQHVGIDDDAIRAEVLGYDDARLARL
tara:strand:+ start:340 stop:507 length:168 start_codon:yes stop_codon:yes gene_type:complete